MLRHLCQFRLSLLCPILFIAILCCESTATPTSVEGTGNTVTDTVNLGTLTSRLGYYRSVSAAGVRISLRGPTRFKSVEIPVVGKIGQRLVFRILGNEHDASVPGHEVDITTPLVVELEKNGAQRISVNFNQPEFYKLSQYFLLLDSIPPDFKLVTNTQPDIEGCNCKTETFKQQVVKQDGEWKVAPYLFPWRVITEVRQEESKFSFKADTINPSSNSFNTEKFGLLVADINRDGLVDILTQQGLYLNRGNRQFSELELSKISTEDGAWTSMQSGYPELVQVRAGTRASIESQFIENNAAYTSLKQTRLSVTKIEIAAQGLARAVWFLPDTAGVAPDGGEKLLVLVSDTVGSLDHFILIKTDPKRKGLKILSDVQLMGKFASIVSLPGNNQCLSFVCAARFQGQLKLNKLSICEGGIELGDVWTNHSNTLEVLGPGIDGITKYSAMPLFTPIRTNVDSPNSAITQTDFQASVNTLEAEMGFDSDRRASILRIDLDGNGTEEIVLTTSDTCYRPYIVTSVKEGAVRSAKQSVAVYDCLNVLAGSPDLAAADFDGDGARDMVGIRNGNLIVVWNQTVQQQVGIDDRQIEISQRRDIRSRSQFRGIFVTDYTELLPYGNTSSQARNGNDEEGGNAQQGTSQTEIGGPLSVLVIPSVFSTDCIIKVQGPKAQMIAKVQIHNTLGVTVKTIENIRLEDGNCNVSWNGEGDSGIACGVGQYMIVVTSENERAVGYTQRVR